jgi:signal recognition particle GTPase
LLQADIGAVTSSKIISDLRIYAREEGLEVDDIFPILRARLIEALTPADIDNSLNSAPVSSPKIPTVIFVIGANGLILLVL